MKVRVVLWLSLAMLLSSARAEPGSVYFKVTTVNPEPGQLAADTWSGAFEVANLTLAVTNTSAVSLTTSFVGGLTQEPGFWFDSGADFVWQGDNTPPSANSTMRSQELVDAILAGATWEDLFDNSFALLEGVTTDLSALNPTAFRVSGQGGTITFSREPFPLFDPYAQWLTNYPTLTETGKLADPDGDGFNNGAEFAFDGDPTTGTPTLLTITGTASNAVISFVAHNTLFPDNYVVLSTTNLATAPFATNAVATGAMTNSADQSGVLLSNIYTRKEFTAPVSLKEFFRVRALLP